LSTGTFESELNDAVGLRPLKKKVFRDERGTIMRLDNLGKSTTLESNKSLQGL
jgi:hypothetical protein